MKSATFLKLVFQRFLLVGFALGATWAAAQPAGTLYDPEPPSDSAYVRVLNGAKDAPLLDVVVDGKKRGTQIGFGQVNDYMVLAAGKHTIAIHQAGKESALVSYVLDVVKGKALTLTFPSRKPGTAPIIFEDKSSTNKLKAMLSVYHVDSNFGPMDVLTGDGNTKVFSGIAYGTSMAVPVNPITIELISAKAGEKLAKAKAQLEMVQGASYSVFFLADGAGKSTSRTVQNKTEVYTAK